MSLSPITFHSTTKNLPTGLFSPLQNPAPSGRQRKKLPLAPSAGGPWISPGLLPCFLSSTSPLSCSHLSCIGAGPRLFAETAAAGSKPPVSASISAREQPSMTAVASSPSPAFCHAPLGTSVRISMVPSPGRGLPELLSASDLDPSRGTRSSFRPRTTWPRQTDLPEAASLEPVDKATGL